MESGSLNLQEPSGPVPFNHILYLSLSYPFSYFESHLVCTYIEFIFILSKMEVLIMSVLQRHYYMMGHYVIVIYGKQL